MKEMLFDVPEQPSPRLKWMRDHRVVLKETPAELVGQEDEIGDEIKKFYAYIDGEKCNGDYKRPSWFGQGDTEDEALIALAVKKHWKDWRQENI